MALRGLVLIAPMVLALLALAACGNSAPALPDAGDPALPDAGVPTTDAPPDATCQDESCCPMGQSICGGVCVDLMTSAAHCGECNQTCDGPNTCDDGICCAEGLAHCSGTTCTNLDTDSYNCGACNKVCASGTSCDSGVCCDPATEHEDDGLCCPIGWVNCGGVCRDLDSATSCGTTCATAVMCAGDQVCDDGACASSCDANETTCAGACVDTAVDEAHCGGCAGGGGEACAIGQTCSSGACGACPAATPTECEAPQNRCVDPTFDSANCGDCNSRCALGEQCRETSIQVGSASQAGSVATFDTVSPHGLSAGDEVIVRNMSIAGYNGAWEVASVSTPTRFTATLPVAGLAAATGGATSVVASGMCCGIGLDACGGQCLDLAIDPLNCGACGTVCPANEACSDGACVPMLPVLGKLPRCANAAVATPLLNAFR